MIPEDAIWILELIRNRDARTEAEKDAVNAAIEALKAQLSQEGTTLDLISRQAAIDALDCINGVEEVLRSLPTVQPEQQHGRVFKGIVVKYPEYCIYPEYKGKPYFSIKYTENGQEFIGYSTYKLEVLSEYLKEYFMPSAQPEPHWIPCSERMPLPKPFEGRY